jgi:hypothetical protein
MSADTDTADQPWRDADTLERLYIDDGLSRPEVADRLGCSPSTVDSWLQRHDIRRADTDADRREYTDAELLDYLRVHADDGQMPTKETIRSKNGPSTVTFANRFGSWNDAAEAAGLTPNQPGRKKEYTDGELIEWLHSWVALQGTRPSPDDFNDPTSPTPSMATYINRWGSWEAALEAAGITGGDAE